MRLHTLMPAVALAAFASTASFPVLSADVAVPTEKCDAAWTMASPNGDAIVKGQNVPFVLDFIAVDSNNDGSIQADEFNKACSEGKVNANESVVNDMK